MFCQLLLSLCRPRLFAPHARTDRRIRFDIESQDFWIKYFLLFVTFRLFTPHSQRQCPNEGHKKDKLVTTIIWYLRILMFYQLLLSLCFPGLFAPHAQTDRRIRFDIESQDFWKKYFLLFITFRLFTPHCQRQCPNEGQKNDKLVTTIILYLRILMFCQLLLSLCCPRLFAPHAQTDRQIRFDIESQDFWIKYFLLFVTFRLFASHCHRQSPNEGQQKDKLKKKVLKIIKKS
jgi:hypothetical protein